MQRIGSHGPVFADAKLHDIPNTVERASANIARLGRAMFNVHALGGEAMMRAARAGADRGAIEAGLPPPLVIAVTVLSSQSGEGLASRRVARVRGEDERAGRRRRVGRGRARTCVRSCGDEFCLVVPGIRPAGGNGHDQVRVLTPAAAIEQGADYIVVGRPITAADDPVGVARAILREAR